VILFTQGRSFTPRSGSWMKKRITLEEYIKFDEQKRLNYVMEQLKLKAPVLFGTVKKSDSNDYVVIEKLFNAFSDRYIDQL
jgi:hypothetical protein